MTLFWKWKEYLARLQYGNRDKNEISLETIMRNFYRVRRPQTVFLKMIVSLGF